MCEKGRPAGLSKARRPGEGKIKVLTGSPVFFIIEAWFQAGRPVRWAGVLRAGVEKVKNFLILSFSTLDDIRISSTIQNSR